jgi:hypothetical protein
MENRSTNLLPPKRDIIVAFRHTGQEAAHVDAAAAGLKRPRTRGDFCRTVTLHASKQRVPEPVKPIRLPPRRLPRLDTQLLSKLLAEVDKVGSAFNKMARTRPSGDPSTPAMLVTIAADIADIRDAVITALTGQGDEASR